MAFDWKSTLATVAPVLGTAIGGPFGGIAAKAIASALLPADQAATATEDQIAQAVAGMTPDDALKLKQAEYDFKLKLQQLQNDATAKEADYDVQLENIAETDRDSARKREMAVKDLTPMVIAYAVTVGFFAILFFMLMNGIPDKGHDVLMVMLGSLGTAFATVLAYYFGSSAGSARKTEIMNGANQ